MDLFTIKFLRNFTVEAIERPLRALLREAGVEAALDYGGFATARAEVAAGEGAAGPGLTVLALGLEQAGSGYGHADWPLAEICEDIYNTVAAACAQWRSTLVINTVLAPLFDAFGLAESVQREKHAETVAGLNQRLRALAREHAGRVVLCDWERYARRLGERGTYDYRFWFSAGAPFAGAFLQAYAQDIARAARVLAGRPRKCLVLDCDNTLWGGIVGEDGADGIALSRDTTPGRYYREFQQCVLDLHARGVVLAIASKNNPDDVLQVLDQHPEMLLRRADLAAWRINWNHKVQSLQELAAELGLGLDSFVLVDDSALECELVRQALPQVTVLRMPERVEEIAHFLLLQDPFEALASTREDLLRADSYRQNRERREMQGDSADLGEFLRRVQTRIVVRSCSAADVARAAQLTQRTNQFNLTTQRLDAAGIAARLADADSRVLCLEVADRFGDFGLTGLLIATRDGARARIENLLLSCRVLGREVEFAFVAAALTLLRQRWGSTRVRAGYRASSKNAQVADFWPRCGLSPLPAIEDGLQCFASDDLAAIVENHRHHPVTVEVRE